MMKRLTGLLCAAALSISMVAVSSNQAEAGDRGRLIAGLIIGSVAGVIVGSQIRHYHQPQYYAYRGQRIRFGHGQIWRQHVSYCYGRYRSYNHHTNLFLAYSGHYRHCRSPWIG